VSANLRPRRFLAPAVLVLLAAAAAAPPAPAPPCGAPAVADDDDTPLVQEMEQLDAAMEFLKRSILDAAQDARSLEQVVIAEQACLASKQRTPRMAAGLPDAERARFVADYRRGMIALLAGLLELETALLDGDRERARAAWKKLDRMKDEGHDAFTDGG